MMVDVDLLLYSLIKVFPALSHFSLLPSLLEPLFSSLSPPCIRSISYYFWLVGLLLPLYTEILSCRMPSTLLYAAYLIYQCPESPTSHSNAVGHVG